MTLRYWLFKSEPEAYSFDDLVNDKVAEWDGVRNYQARNLLRDDVQEGDCVFFYHSGAKNMALIGTAIVVRSGYPDHTAWDPTSDHPDPKSNPGNPIWYMVDIKPLERFTIPLTLAALKANPQLPGMALLQRGSRLSDQPVSPHEWKVIREMGDLEPVK